MVEIPGLKSSPRGILFGPTFVSVHAQILSRDAAAVIQFRVHTYVSSMNTIVGIVHMHMHIC